MPKLSPPREVPHEIAQLLVGHFGAVRLAIGWNVARQAGVKPTAFGHHHLVGWDLLNKWEGAKRTPPDFAQFAAAGKAFYRVRALALLLNGHPWAEVCGGAEQWWQLILAEDLLADISCRIAVAANHRGSSQPKPRNRAAVIWWLRRGINPMCPITEPATWALMEAVQQRLFPGRPACSRPADEVEMLQPLIDLPFLNGQRSLAVRKRLLLELTGRADGFTPNTQLELHRDWVALLSAWEQLGATTKPTNSGRTRLVSHTTHLLTPAEHQHLQLAAIAIHDEFLPDVWESVLRVRDALNQKPLEKPSICKGSEPPKQIQRTGPPNPLAAPQSVADFTQRQKTGSGRQAPTKPASPDLSITTPQPIDSAVNNQAHQVEAQL